MSKATRVVVDGVSYPLDDTTAVDFSEAQSLNAAEKQQARTNIGLGNVDDTSDANKPISTAQQTALNAKLDTANVYNGLDKSASGYALDARQGKVLADKLDATQSDIAIIIEGNQTTHTGGVAVGEYVIVCNSTISGITDGLYKATQAIPANTAIDSTYLAAVEGGGLNAVNRIIGDIIKYKDYKKTDTYTANEFGQVADLDSDGVTGYTPISVVKILPIASVDANKRLVPYIYNYNHATRLMVHNISGAAITTGVEYTYRVYFVKASLITSE